MTEYKLVVVGGEAGAVLVVARPRLVATETLPVQKYTRLFVSLCLCEELYVNVLSRNSQLVDVGLVVRVSLAQGQRVTIDLSLLRRVVWYVSCVLNGMFNVPEYGSTPYVPYCTLEMSGMHSVPLVAF